MTYLSGHFYFDGPVYGTDSDRVIFAITDPALRMSEAGGDGGFFFVRYRDSGGVHVRLRVRNALPSFVDAVLDAVGFERGAGSESTADPSSLCLRYVRWIPYEPEVVRYAGPAGLPIAESVFEASSVAALRLLRVNADYNDQVRSSLALVSAIVMAKPFCSTPDLAANVLARLRDGVVARASRSGTDRRELIDSFEESYQRQRETMRRLVRGAWGLEELPPPFLDALLPLTERLSELASSLRGQWLAGNLEYPGESRDWAACAGSLMPSYVHMMNNRIGITVMDEACLAHAAVSVLRDEDFVNT